MESFENKTVYGNFAVYNTCLEPNKCKHIVENIKTGEKKTMLGISIYKILIEAGISVPHFVEQHAGDREIIYLKKQLKAENNIFEKTT
jgi:hypothetical protein